MNWLGQGLIQSASKNTSTDTLERDLEDVNTRWKTLNKKVCVAFSLLISFFWKLAFFDCSYFCFLPFKLVGLILPQGKGIFVQGR